MKRRSCHRGSPRRLPRVARTELARGLRGRFGQQPLPASPRRWLRRSPGATTAGAGSTHQADLALLTRQVRRGEAQLILDAAAASLELWEDRLDFAELADDIAVEARLALALSHEIHELDERIAVSLKAADPWGIMTSVPGVAVVNGAQILARLGDPNSLSLAGGGQVL